MSIMKSKKTFPVAAGQSQRGSMLLEALIGIIIFSLGVLGLMGLQAASIRNTSEAKYRSDAAFLADKIIAQMWVVDPTNRVAQYSSPGGAAFVNWRDNEVRAPNGLPSKATAPATPAPTIVINAQPNNDHIVTVTVSWQTPTDPASHQYVTTARINSKTY